MSERDQPLTGAGSGRTNPAITAHRVVLDRVADAIAEEVADLEEVVGGNAGWERAAARAAIAELRALGLLDQPEQRQPPPSNRGDPVSDQTKAAIPVHGVPTFRVDFNAPRFVAHGDVHVGDVVRLVDLDPGAGWSYARVTSIRAAFRDGIVCHYERVGEFYAWPESYVIHRLLGDYR